MEILTLPNFKVEKFFVDFNKVMLIAVDKPKAFCSYFLLSLDQTVLVLQSNDWICHSFFIPNSVH